MDDRPRLLDLFCGAGGASMGYHQAGFYVVGVDLEPQPYYPFEFHQCDALAFPTVGFDAIHASPPCQAYTTAAKIVPGRTPRWPGLITETRHRLENSGVPWVMENVRGAVRDMNVTFRLTGGMFGLGVERARYFESSFMVLTWRAPVPEGAVGVYGQRPDPTGRSFAPATQATRMPMARSLEEAREAMGMEWADWHGTKEAIPPAYTRFIGCQLLEYLGLS